MPKVLSVKERPYGLGREDNSLVEFLKSKAEVELSWMREECQYRRGQTGIHFLDSSSVQFPESRASQFPPDSDSGSSNSSSSLSWTERWQTGTPADRL